MDRNVFDPTKAYDPVAEIGVKWVRIQSGWQRTEQEKGIYDFAWLDDIVDNLLKRGLKPWMCLCYGNELYDERDFDLLYGSLKRTVAMRLRTETDRGFDNGFPFDCNLAGCVRLRQRLSCGFARRQHLRASGGYDGKG